MSELLWFRIGCALGGVVLGIVTAGVLRLNAQTLKRVEPWPRNRLWGMLLGWIALAVCVPHAAVVAPGFLVPLLWPLAVAVPVLGYFYVDYPLARALGGLMILGSYYLIHSAFNLSSPLLPLLAGLGWSFGLAGIWISGRPCALRDWLRKCSASRVWRWTSVVLLDLLTISLLAAAIWTKGEAHGL